MIHLNIGSDMPLGCSAPQLNTKASKPLCSLFESKSSIAVAMQIGSIIPQQQLKIELLNGIQLLRAHYTVGSGFGILKKSSIQNTLKNTRGHLSNFIKKSDQLQTNPKRRELLDTHNQFRQTSFWEEQKAAHSNNANYITMLQNDWKKHGAYSHFSHAALLETGALLNYLLHFTDKIKNKNKANIPLHNQLNRLQHLFKKEQYRINEALYNRLSSAIESETPIDIDPLTVLLKKLARCQIENLPLNYKGSHHPYTEYVSVNQSYSYLQKYGSPYIKSKLHHLFSIKDPKSDTITPPILRKQADRALFISEYFQANYNQIKVAPHSNSKPLPSYHYSFSKYQPQLINQTSKIDIAGITEVDQGWFSVELSDHDNLSSKNDNNGDKAGKWVITFDKGHTELNEAWTKSVKLLQNQDIHLIRASAASDAHPTQVLEIYTNRTLADRARVFRLLEEKALTQDFAAPITYKTASDTQHNMQHEHCHQISHIAEEVLLIEIREKLKNHTYQLHGGGITYKGKRYAKSAGQIIQQIEAILRQKIDLNNESAIALIKSQCANLIQIIQTKLQAKTTSTSGHWFFGLGRREQSTATLYADILQSLNRIGNASDLPGMNAST